MEDGTICAHHNEVGRTEDDNVIAGGALFPCECVERLCDVFQTGDDVEIDIPSARLTQRSSGNNFQLRSLGAVAPVVAAGGIFEYARREGMI